MEADETWNELLEKNRKMSLEAFEHQDYPYEQLVEDLRIPRDVSRNPLFDILLVVQNYSEEAGLLQVDGLGYEPFELPSKQSLFDLSFGFMEKNGKLEFALEYNTDLFTQHKAESISRHFEQILASYLKEPEMPALKTSLLTVDQQNQLNESISIPKQQAGSAVGVVELFRRQAKFLPKSIALESGERKWTYAEIDEITDRLAIFLINRFGIINENLVAIELERSEWLPIAQMAIMKAGGSFLPIDPEFPEERKQFILADSGAIAEINMGVIEEFQIQGNLEASSLPVISSSQLAYCLYTSGSTGQPKGVLMEHGEFASPLSFLIYYSILLT
jgi:non-ribosomal peptide synthetase component F